MNPFLAPEHRLSACEQVAAEEAEEYAYEEPVAGVDEVQGTFVNGVTGNVAGGIGGGAIGEEPLLCGDQESRRASLEAQHV